MPKQRSSPRIKRKYKINNVERQARKERMLTIKLTKIVLKNRHHINGVAFGPGSIRVPADVARVLSEQDQRSEQAEQAFQTAKGVIIGPSVRGQHRIFEVPLETFDDSLENAGPAIVQRVGNRKE